MKSPILAILMVAGVLAVLVGLLALIDRGGGPPPPMESSSSTVTAYGDRVYYFDSARQFGPALATFFKDHPDLRVVSIAPLDNCGYGSTRGYWVVVEKNAK